jgi:hypothetical protein
MIAMVQKWLGMARIAIGNLLFAWFRCQLWQWYLKGDARRLLMSFGQGKLCAWQKLMWGRMRGRSSLSMFYR